MATFLSARYCLLLCFLLASFVPWVFWLITFLLTLKPPSHQQLYAFHHASLSNSLSTLLVLASSSLYCSSLLLLLINHWSKIGWRLSGPPQEIVPVDFPWLLLGSWTQTHLTNQHFCCRLFYDSWSRRHCECMKLMLIHFFSSCFINFSRHKSRVMMVLLYKSSLNHNLQWEVIAAVLFGSCLYLSLSPFTEYAGLFLTVNTVLLCYKQAHPLWT